MIPLSSLVVRACRAETFLELAEARKDFLSRYADYRNTRESLHEQELVHGEHTQESAYNALRAIKEDLFATVVRLYTHTTSLEAFEQEIRRLVTTREDTSGHDFEMHMLGSYIYPYSLLHADDRSPVQSIYATMQNFKIVEEFVRIGSPHSQGMLMSGAHAWGPFFAVKGKIPEAFVKLGVEQLPIKEFSDIDLLASFSDIAAMEQFVGAYTHAGLVPVREKERFIVFKALFGREAVDIFSMRTHWQGVEESIHCLLNRTVEKIATCTLPLCKPPIWYVRDFRPNIANSVMQNAKKDGYLIWNITLGEKSALPVTFEPFTDASSGDMLGYLTQTPAYGIGVENERQCFFEGLLSFFFLVAPVILAEKENFLTLQVRNLARCVQGIQRGKLPAHIIREERMPLCVREIVKAHHAGRRNTP